MTKKVIQRIIIIFFIIAFFTVLGVALTSARYTTVKNPDNHTGELEYTVENQVLITSTEQFFAAIENGYSNIKIADSVANPFLISGSANVTSDLIMDLNGHQIQRNSREPMLTVTEGVKMVVTDTSKAQSGSFYNPVGSVLKVDGGVLTIMDNKFESGVRKNEYLSNSNTTEYIGGDISADGEAPRQMNVAVKDANADGGYTTTTWDNVPILHPTVQKSTVGSGSEGARYFVNGNVYFDSNYFDPTTKKPQSAYTTNTYNENIAKEDTYLYFTIDDSNAASNTIVAAKGSADFHYTYYVNAQTGADGLPEYKYVATPDENSIEVTVYGYYDAIKSARNETADYTPTNPSNFAAIKTMAGSVYARGGEFYSYFGVDTSSCIYADEGELFVYDGSFTAIEDGSCVRCNYLKPDSSLVVSGGFFKSYRGNIIDMENGEMDITGGLFVQDSSAYVDATEWTSAINMEKGMLRINATEQTPVNFYMAGSYMAAIRCGGDAEFYARYTNFTFGTDGTPSTEGLKKVEGSHNMGIYGEGGTITVNDCVFTMPGDNGYGIYTLADTSTRAGTRVFVNASVFSMGGRHSRAINAKGGEINIGGSAEQLANEPIPRWDNTGDMMPVEAYSLFYLDHVDNCYGVYAEADEGVNLNINIRSAQFLLGNGYSVDKDNNVTYYQYEEPTAEQAAQLQADEQVWSSAVYMDAPQGNIALGRVYVLHAGSFASGIQARRGTISRINDRTAQQLTVAVFMGSRYKGYLNGGLKDATSTIGGRQDKWSYVPRLDEEYIQTENYDTYYNNIANVDGAKNNFGICCKGGNVSLDRVYVNVRSNNARGMYASSAFGEGRVTINTLHANIDNKKIDGSVPENLTTSAMVVRGGAVVIGDADIRSNGIGIILDDGSIGLTGNVTLTSISSSVLYMRNTHPETGNTKMVLGKNADVTVNCTIIPSVNDSSKPRPWKLNVGTTVESYNGINIKGGDFIANGDLRVNFTGLDNDDQEPGVYDPFSIHIKSFAINVEDLGDVGGKPTVTLFHTHIVTEVGGGLAVKGGTCTLGKDPIEYDDADKNVLNTIHGGDYDAMVTIETKGDKRYENNLHRPAGAESTNWDYYCSQTGGPAVKVRSGLLTVHHGTYQAAMGNGILIEDGKAVVYDGNFTGNYNSTKEEDGFKVGSGLASFCGLMLRGGGIFESYGGTFSGFNGGAFVAGRDESHRGLANIYGGSYKAANVASGTPVGTRNTNGFSVGGHAVVTIGKETLTETDKPIEIAGYSCAVAVENNYALGNRGKVDVTIQGGTIMTCYRTFTANGIWKGNEQATLTLGECAIRVTNYNPDDGSVSPISNVDGMWTAVLKGGTNTTLKVYVRETPTTTTYTEMNPRDFNVANHDYYEYVISETMPPAPEIPAPSPTPTT